MVNKETLECILCGSNNYKKIGRVEFYKKFLSLVRCRFCGLAFVAPLPAAEDRRDYFQIYTKITDEDIQYYRLNKLFNVKYDIEILKKHIPGGKLLDIGFGYGLFLEYARAEGFEVSGQEISAGSCRYARDELGLDVVHGDFENLDFKPLSYDIVTIFDTLYYMFDPLAVLKKINTLLKENGIIMLRVHNRLFYMRFFGKNLNRNPFFTSDHVYAFSAGSIKNILEKAGFENIEIFNSRLFYRPGENTLLIFLKRTAIFIMDIIKILTFKKIYLGTSITVIAKKKPDYEL